MCCVQTTKCANYNMTELEGEEFTKHQLQELEEAFALFDKDGDGFITTDELCSVMRSLRQQATEEEIAEMIHQVDIDGNGKIDYEEFVQLLETQAERQPEDAQLRALFKAFDKDNSGYIDASELKETMGELGIQVSDAEVKMMLRQAGVKGHDRIYYEDFVHMMSGQIGQLSKPENFTAKKVAVHANGTGMPSREEIQEIKELRVAFAMFDTDADGVISTKELRGVIRHLGLDVSSLKIKQMMAKVDLDGNGTIEFDEFCKMMRKNRDLGCQYKNVPKAEENEMRQAFRVFDKDGSGAIDGKELQATMRQLGVQLTDADVKAMLKEAGVGPNGKIYYEEFVKIMFGNILRPVDKKPGDFSDEEIQELKVAFSLFDKDGDGAITADELRTVIRTLELQIDEKSIQKMIDRFDYDRNGTLEFNEFIEVMRGKKTSSGTKHQAIKQRADESEAWRVFKIFDKDRNGYISAVELKRTMKELGLELTDDDAACMIKEADLDGDGRINYQEFAKIYVGEFKSLVKEISEQISPSPTSSTQSSPKQPSQASPKQAMSSKQSSPKQTLQASPKQALLKKSSPKLTLQIPPKQTLVKQSSPTQPSLQQPLQKQKHNKEEPPTKQTPHQEEIQPGNEKELKAAFDVVDTDGDGMIQVSELAMVMRSLGMNFNRAQLRQMLARNDQTGNGTVDFQEFLRMMATTRSRNRTEEQRKKVEEDEMRQAFRVFDIDGNGYIDAQELKLTMRNLGENLTDDDVRAMLDEADVNKDGKIDYEEFIRMMYNK